jgi:ankyrin repeat protein
MKSKMRMNVLHRIFICSLGIGVPLGNLLSDTIYYDRLIVCAIEFTNTTNQGLVSILRFSDYINRNESKIMNENKEMADGRGDSEIFIKQDTSRLVYNGMKTIWEAAAEGDTEVLKQFLDLGVDVNSKGSGDDCTPLICGAMTGQVKAVQLLLRHGADVNLREINGWTPLMYAAVENHIEIVKLLLEAGADVKIEALNQEGETALTLAIRKGNSKIVELLNN